MLPFSDFPLSPFARSSRRKKKPKILYFTKSAGYVHSVVKRKGDALAYSEKVSTELGAKHDFDVECSQDAAVFDGDLDRYDLIAFYTSGNPLSEEQKEKLLDAVSAGKPFVGLHAATDSFRHKDKDDDRIDPYTAMIGAEFIKHGASQEATMKVLSPEFPGVEKLGESFCYFDEWYTFRKFAKDLHVILLQETAGMKGKAYERPSFPATWARMHNKGRVFYTSMGHFEKVWDSDVFQQVLLGGLTWALGRANADVSPNIEKVAPKVLE